MSGLWACLTCGEPLSSYQRARAHALGQPGRHIGFRIVEEPTTKREVDLLAKVDADHYEQVGNVRLRRIDRGHLVIVPDRER